MIKHLQAIEIYFSRISAVRPGAYVRIWTLRPCKGEATADLVAHSGGSLLTRHQLNV